MSRILEPSEKFKITTIKLLKALIEKVYNMQDQIGQYWYKEKKKSEINKRLNRTEKDKHLWKLIGNTR